LVDQLTLKAGDSAVLTAATKLTIVAKQPSVLFKSFVPK